MHALLTENVKKHFEQALYLSHTVEWSSSYKAETRKRFAASLGFVVRTTPVCCPESNGMAESFIRMFRCTMCGQVNYWVLLI